MDNIPLSSFEWLNSITQFFFSLAQEHKYLSFFLGMAIESVGIPFGSMPALVTTSAFVTSGDLNIYWVIFVGALGNTLGSSISYFIGRFFGETIRKFKKSHKVFKSEEMLENFTKKYGTRTIFLAQLFGFTRVFISFPAGILKMNFRKFITSTFFGGALFTAWYVLGSFVIRDFYDRFIYPIIGISFATIFVIVGLSFVATHFSWHLGKKAHKKIVNRIQENARNNRH